MKKLVAPIMAAVLAASMTVPAMADYKVSYSGSASNNVGITTTQEEVGKANIKNTTTNQTKVKSLSDVPSSHWAYDSIMNMVNKGIIAGTTQPVNGVGTFAPTAPMTRAQFITVVTRYLYADEISQQRVGKDDPWYQANYNVAVNKGLIKKTEFNSSASVMNQAMNRQEMSMVLVRAMGVLGEDISAKVSSSRIPDMNKVGSYYKDYVRIAYKAGMIAGVDDAGTFNPMGTLNRAQAATVLNRLIDKSTRVDIGDGSIVGSDIGGSGYADNNSGVTENVQTTGNVYHEGQKHAPVVAGDTIIDAETGKKVVLQWTVVGNTKVLGYGTGIDFVTGTTKNGITLSGDKMGAPWKGYGDQSAWVKDPQSGEVHTENEWMAIMMAQRPTYNGTYDGETAGTADGVLKGAYYKWDGLRGTWYWIGPAGM